MACLRKLILAITELKITKKRNVRLSRDVSVIPNDFQSYCSIEPPLDDM